MDSENNNRYLFNIREVLHKLDMIENGYAEPVLEWCRDNIRRNDEIYESNVYNKLIERNLGLRPGKGMLESRYDSFFKPNYSCQIEVLPYILEDIFGQKTDGYFVEIGAFDGEHYSNTSFLADLGWRGLYVEPIHEYYQLCRHRHAVNPGVHVVQGAAGPSLSLIDIQIALMSSTSKPFFMEELRRLDFARPWVTEEKRTAFACRMDFYLEKFAVPKDFDLLVLDVEGAEWDALQGVDFDDWKPRVLIIELMDDHKDFADNKDVIEVGTRCRAHLSRWYDELFVDDSNTIFVRR